MRTKILLSVVCVLLMVFLVSCNGQIFLPVDKDELVHPIIDIHTDDGRDITTKTWLSDLNSPLATMTVRDSDNNSNELEIDIKCRGNSSFGFPKKSFTIKLSEKKNLLDLADGKHKSYALLANYTDKTLIRNQLGFYLGNEVFTNMDWNPHCTQVNVFLNDNYFGLYLLIERIKIDDKELDIPDVGKTDSFSEGGWIVEVNSRLDETFNWTTSRNIPISLKDPDDYEDYHLIEDYINDVEAVLYGENWLDSVNGWRKYIDEDSFIDWYLVNEIARNNDACWWSSVYMYLDPSDQKIHMGPLWDFDIGFGNTSFNGNESPEGFWIKNYGWHARLFEDPSFVAAVKARWNEKKMDFPSVASQFVEAVRADSYYNFRQWGILGTDTMTSPPGFAERKTYQSEVDYLLDWLEERTQWLDGAINQL